MHDETVEPIVVGTGGWQVLTSRDWPWVLDHYRSQADRVEEIAESDQDGFVFAGIQRPGDDWPSLMISQAFSPAVGGFSPGVLIAPETQRVFVGAGRELFRRQWAG